MCGLNYKVIFTDSSFKNSIKKKGFLHAHCPYHRSKKGFFLFLLGLIPEWRGKYSNLWVFFFLRGKFHIVYSFFYSLDNVRFAAWIAKKKKCKHVVHVADHTPTFFNSPEFKLILDSCHKRACIGRNMRDAYVKKFGLNFNVFHNYADFKHLPLSPDIDSSFNHENPFKVLFLGSLFSHLHKGAINDICKAISSLSREGYPVIFNLYGQRVPVDFLSSEIDGKSIKHHGEVPPADRFKIMHQHHAFVVPSTFDPDLANEYCYSIPTKLPELLASGRPTIIYGPASMESHRFCNDNNCGFLIKDRSIEMLQNTLIKIMQNYQEQLSESIDQANRIKPLLSISTQVPRFHNFLLT